MQAEGASRPESESDAASEPAPPAAPAQHPTERASRRRFWLTLVPLLAVAWVALESFAGISWKLNRSYNPPLDDTYIYYQYAKQIARGQLYRYQDGEPPSTGSTSLLYPWLLAPFWLVGLQGKLLFWGGYYVNLGGLLLAVGCVFAALRRLLPHDRWLPPLGALLVVGNGWFMWGVASGMDTGVLAGSLGLGALGVVRYLQERRARLLGLGLGLLGVSRPEGLVLAWAMAAAIWVLEASSAGPGRWLSLGRWLRARPPLPVLAGLVGGTLPTLALALASGHLSTNGMALKSHFAHAIGWPRYLDVVSRTTTAFFERMLWTPTAWLRGVMVVALLAGIAGLWRPPAAAEHDGDRRAAYGPGPAFAAAFLALFLFYGFLMAATEQHNRYYMAYTPLVALLAIAGVDTVAAAIPRASVPFRRAAALALVLIGLGSVPHWAKEYAHNSRDLADQHLAMARWIDHNLPRDAVLAINDAGAIAYLGGRRVVDVLGLVTNATRAESHWREEGHMWEVLERMRPSHLVVYPSFFDDLHRMPVMRRIHAINLGRDTLLGDREKVVYEVQWARALAPEVPRRPPFEYAAWRQVGSLDVADALDERAHRYRIRQGGVTGADRYRLRAFAVPGGHVIDGGRCFDQSERFVASGLQPGKPLLLGVRSDFRDELELEPVVAGASRPPWSTGVPGQRQLLEGYLMIPADAVTSPELEIELRARPRLLGRPRFCSYHYFFLQPR